MSIVKTLKISLIFALFIAVSASFVAHGDGSDIPPADITDLATAGGAGSNSVQLTWTAPGADGYSEPATAYDMRLATFKFTSAQWSSLTRVTGISAPGNPGTQESFTLTGLNPSTTYYVAVRGVDSFNVLSQVFNIINFTTASAGPTTVSNVTFLPKLEGTAIPAAKDFTISFYNAGSLTKAAEFTAMSDSSGWVALPDTVLLAGGLYDITVSSSNYLRKKIFEYNLASNANVALPALPAGDFNNDSIINSLDSSYMGARWFSNNTTADINGDGVVNSIDWSFLGKNWFKTGD